MHIKTSKDSDFTHQQSCDADKTISGSLWDYVNPMDTEALAKDFERGEPFRFILVDDFLRPDFAREVCQAYPSYEDAMAISDREFKAVNEYRKIQVTDSNIFPEPVQLLSEALISQELCDTLTEITGISGLLGDPKFRGGWYAFDGDRIEA